MQRKTDLGPCTTKIEPSHISVPHSSATCGCRNQCCSFQLRTDRCIDATIFTKPSSLRSCIYQERGGYFGGALVGHKRCEAVIMVYIHIEHLVGLTSKLTRNAFMIHVHGVGLSQAIQTGRCWLKPRHVAAVTPSVPRAQPGFPRSLILFPSQAYS